MEFLIQNIKDSEDRKDKVIKQALSLLEKKPDQLRYLLEQHISSCNPYDFHQSNPLVWVDEIDYKKIVWQRKTITIGAVFRKISTCGRFYLSLGRNSHDKPILIYIPREYLHHHSLYDANKIEWELLLRLSFTQVTNLEVSQLSNIYANKFDEVIVIRPDQTIWDLSSPLPSTEENPLAIATHYCIKCCPDSDNNGFPYQWPSPSTVVLDSQRNNSFQFYDITYHATKFILDQAPKAKTLSKTRICVVKPLLGFVAPSIPVETWIDCIFCAPQSPLQSTLLFIEEDAFKKHYYLFSESETGDCIENPLKYTHPHSLDLPSYF